MTVHVLVAIFSKQRYLLFIFFLFHFMLFSVSYTVLMTLSTRYSVMQVDVCWLLFFLQHSCAHSLSLPIVCCAKNRSVRILLYAIAKSRSLSHTAAVANACVCIWRPNGLACSLRYAFNANYFDEFTIQLSLLFVLYIFFLGFVAHTWFSM